VNRLRSGLKLIGDELANADRKGKVRQKVSTLPSSFNLQGRSTNRTSNIEHILHMSTIFFIKSHRTGRERPRQGEAHSSGNGSTINCARKVS